MSTLKNCVYMLASPLCPLLKQLAYLAIKKEKKASISINSGWNWGIKKCLEEWEGRNRRREKHGSFLIFPCSGNIYKMN